MHLISVPKKPCDFRFFLSSRISPHVLGWITLKGPRAGENIRSLHRNRSCTLIVTPLHKQGART